MPTDVQVILQGASGLPQDRFINVLHFDGDQWDASKADELWTKYDAFYNQYGGGLQGGAVHEIRAYAPGVNPGGPYFSKKYATTTTRGLGGPNEIALCLSYAAVDSPDASTPRRRGRIYLGPFSPTATDESRPNATIRDAALDLGEGIAQVGLAANVTWSLYSRMDNSYHKIESIWCDDAWDIQRRRGLKPTLKEVRDVQ